MMIEEAREAVLAEKVLFREKLPKLLEILRGRWVVFKDGDVQSDHETEEEAYRTGYSTYGRLGGHVVTRVVPQEVIPVTAAVLFGIK